MGVPREGFTPSLGLSPAKGRWPLEPVYFADNPARKTAWDRPGAMLGFGRRYLISLRRMARRPSHRNRSVNTSM